MGKRHLVLPLMVALFLLLSVPAAIAAPAIRASDEPGATVVVTHEGKGPALGQSGNNGNHLGPGGQGKSHAAENAGRGMNRIGAPGSWGDQGHTPAAVSAPQGYAPSDPDFTGNGGLDKPGASGGFSPDRDGNNGCGNDDDREDDNNGWCGRRVEAGPPTAPPPLPPSKPPIRVAGVKFPPVQPVQLPTTGVDPTTLMFAGWGLVLAGIGVRRHRWVR